MSSSAESIIALQEVSDMFQRIRSDMLDLAKKIERAFSGLSGRLSWLRKGRSFGMSRKILMIAVNLILWLMSHLWFAVAHVYESVCVPQKPHMPRHIQKRLCANIYSGDEPLSLQ